MRQPVWVIVHNDVVPGWAERSELQWVVSYPHWGDTWMTMWVTDIRPKGSRGPSYGGSLVWESEEDALRYLVDALRESLEMAKRRLRVMESGGSK